MRDRSHCLIAYFSQGGTTARVAERIADGLRPEGYRVDLCNIKDRQRPDVSGYDLLGIGLPVYYYRPPFNVTDYVNSLPSLSGLPAFVFVLHGTYRFDAGTTVVRTLARKGARHAGYFHSCGHELWVGYLKEGYIFSPDHPTEEELARAEAFGHQVAAHAVGSPYLTPTDERPPSIVYRVERFLTNRWLATHGYSRLFRVDAERCSTCGLCIQRCPNRNITEGKGGLPIWGRNCLLCLTCELTCPEQAITSPASWRLLRPIMVYNTRRASQDPSIEHLRVDPKSWSRPDGIWQEAQRASAPRD